MVQIIGEDIDLLVLLTQFCEENLDIVLTKINRNKKSKTIYSPNSFKYPHLKKIIAFLHAFSGCDTNSAFFQKGKDAIFKVIDKDNDLINRAQSFYQPEANADELWKIALDIVSKMYVGKKVPINNFNSIRLECYENLKNDINVSRLPPTDLAIKEHAKRVYLQCQDWCLNKLNPLEWGWQENENMLTPIYTSKPLLPEKFLKKFHCSCKTSSGCKKCTCKKLGLRCGKFCKVCKGRDCQNSDNSLSIQDSDNDEDFDEDFYVPIEPEIHLQEVSNEYADVSNDEDFYEDIYVPVETEKSFQEAEIDQHDWYEDNEQNDYSDIEETDIHDNKRPRLE